MHELSLCQALMTQVERTAAQYGAARVSRILLRIGPLAGVEPELLRHAFPVAAAGSCAEGARLDIEAAPVRVRCRSCAAESEAAPNRLICGACGDWRTDLQSGDEMLLASLDLEQEEDDVDAASPQADDSFAADPDPAS